MWGNDSNWNNNCNELEEDDLLLRFRKGDTGSGARGGRGGGLVPGDMHSSLSEFEKKRFLRWGLSSACMIAAEKRLRAYMKERIDDVQLWWTWTAN